MMVCTFLFVIFCSKCGGIESWSPRVMDGNPAVIIANVELISHNTALG